VEQVILEEMPAVEQALMAIHPRTEGKTAMLFVGGSRAHHYQELFSEMGIKTIAAGYEFAHRDDYEGRRVLPTIKVDADSRNIEELHVSADETRFNPRKSPEELEALAQEGLPLSSYEGMMPEMEKGTLIIDDISQHETDLLIQKYKPDVFCAGIKEKYIVQKMGIPLKQLHSYDYGGPFAGFKGAINFYKDIDRMVNTSIWKLITPPWEKTSSSEGLSASYVSEAA
jgi:nitrogenase molybdenum-iron protein alpha chain